MSEEKPVTSLRDKNYEPLIIRKYQGPYGFPVFIALICGDNLDKLDKVHDDFAEKWEKMEERNIQDLRNYFGEMSDVVLKAFKGVEGVAVIAFADKLVVSSLWGDFMTHHQCRLELYSLLNMTTDV
ncbi:MAG: hypothetical protein ACYTFW_09350 [Planctomycetota bacterium]|jgi:hypothetical protein